MLNLKVIPVIMCGGSGTRLWPLSRKKFPKQFLKFSSEVSLFQDTILRLGGLVSEQIEIHKFLIVTNEEHRFLVAEQLREIGITNADIILEPSSKNTSPALTLASLFASQDDFIPILLVIPSDQSILENSQFIGALNNAIRVAENNSIVLFGVKPSRPEVGFGYIKREGKQGIFSEFNISEFIEKPDKATAEKFCADNSYSWNSGIFVMKSNVWISAVQKLSPENLRLCKSAFEQSTYDGNFIRPNPEYFNQVIAESIDYAIMENAPKTIKLKIIPLHARWDDLGSWDSFWNWAKKDIDGNFASGDTIVCNSTNSLVYSSEKLLVTLGIEDLIVIETSDAVLVMPRKKTQEFKGLIDRLKLLNRKELNEHRKIYRPWGWFDIIDEGSNFKVKRIQVNPLSSLSLQKHSKRAEHWIVVKGIAKVICGKKIFYLRQNESTYIPQGELHQLLNESTDVLEIIEVQSGSYLGEDDIVRINDIYGRA